MQKKIHFLFFFVALGAGFLLGAHIAAAAEYEYCGHIGQPPCVPGINIPKEQFTSTSFESSTISQETVPSVAESHTAPDEHQIEADILFEQYEFHQVHAADAGKGFKTAAFDGQMEITIPPGVFSRTIDIHLKKLPYTDTQRTTELFTEKQIVPRRASYDPAITRTHSGGIFEVALKREGVPLSGIGTDLQGGITITLPWPSRTYLKKIIHYWDGSKQKWVPLASLSDFDAHTVSATWHLPYAQFSVFESATIFEGEGSWYRYQNCLCAAIKEYEKGDQYRVTNITPGSPRDGKWVDVIANDYGPELWTTRAIDLDYRAFAAIASPRNGIGYFRVERLSYTEV